MEEDFAPPENNDTASLTLVSIFAFCFLCPRNPADFDDVQMMQQQMNMGANMAAMTNPMQALASEKDNIELVSHKNSAAEAEARLLKTITQRNKK
jgi:hypothetical protein